jgi:ABC-type multidrug transport system fused ATPase/permease subunit
MQQEQKLFTAYGFRRQGPVFCIFMVLLTYCLFSLATLVALLPARSQLRRISTTELQQSAVYTSTTAESDAPERNAKTNNGSDDAAVTPVRLRGLVERHAKGGGYYILSDNDSDNDGDSGTVASVDLEAPLLLQVHSVEDETPLQQFMQGVPASAGCTVLFKDVHYWVKQSGSNSSSSSTSSSNSGSNKQQQQEVPDLHVLRGASGLVEPGQTLCIVGSSGAGSKCYHHYLL